MFVISYLHLCALEITKLRVVLYVQCFWQNQWKIRSVLKQLIKHYYKKQFFCFVIMMGYIFTVEWLTSSCFGIYRTVFFVSFEAMFQTIDSKNQCLHAGNYDLIQSNLFWLIRVKILYFYNLIIQIFRISLVSSVNFDMCFWKTATYISAISSPRCDTLNVWQHDRCWVNIYLLTTCK